jgi:hypothetical protein
VCIKKTPGSSPGFSLPLFVVHWLSYLRKELERPRFVTLIEDCSSFAPASALTSAWCCAGVLAWAPVLATTVTVLACSVGAKYAQYSSRAHALVVSLCAHASVSRMRVHLRLVVVVSVVVALHLQPMFKFCFANVIRTYNSYTIHVKSFFVIFVQVYPFFDYFWRSHHPLFYIYSN